MVEKGQFLERPVAIPTAHGLMLDGLYHRGRRGPACVVAAPHPALGGSMTVPAINELAWALTRAGHATLRFDYRGVGGSQGRSLHVAAGTAGTDAEPVPPRITPALVEGEVADLFAAAAQLAATVGLAEGEGGAGLCAIGYSFGACVVLAGHADPRWERLVLIAPPTALADLGALAEVRRPLLIVCAQHDPLCDRALLQELIAPLGDRVRLEVIPHADHGFRRGSTALGQLVAEWLRAGRPPPRLEREDGGGEEGPEVIELELPDDGEPPLELDDG